MLIPPPPKHTHSLALFLKKTNYLLVSLLPWTPWILEGPVIYSPMDRYLLWVWLCFPQPHPEPPRVSLRTYGILDSLEPDSIVIMHSRRPTVRYRRESMATGSTGHINCVSQCAFLSCLGPWSAYVFHKSSWQSRKVLRKSVHILWPPGSLWGHGGLFSFAWLASNAPLITLPCSSLVHDFLNQVILAPSHSNGLSDLSEGNGYKQV